MLPLRGLDLERPDTTIRYWTVGPDAAPTVVLLHGATLDHHAWDPQVNALRDRFHIVVPDLRGHGDSTGRFDFDAAVEDVLDLLDHLAVDKVVLVGLSLGANIAQAVLRREPDRVLALVVADATCNTAARHPLAATAGVTALQLQAMQSPAAFAHQAARATATDPRVQQYVLDVNAHRFSHETVEILSSLLTTALQPEPAYRLPVPTLLVHGDLDHIGDIASGVRDWAQRDPNARYAVIPHAGHASNLDNPDAFTEVLEAFLDEVVPDDPAEGDQGSKTSPAQFLPAWASRSSAA
jgi:pimeloyl-ACP methyl ester carboxylesterase